MKKRVVFAITLASVLVCTLGACFAIFFLDLNDAFGVHKNQMLSYYENDSNYYTATGTIVEVSHKDEEGCRLKMEKLSYDKEVYGWDPCYYVIHYSNANELWEKWNPEAGMTVSFTSADEIFYDGYTWPIVSISHEDKTVLDFETGKAKLIEWIKR